MPKYYKVGGCVRDKLMGIKSKDIDYAVEAESYDAMKSDLIARGIKIFQERPQFLTIRGNHPVDGSVDFVLCRKDGAYSDGRHPDSVEPGTILDDLARRDFTINAIAESEDGTLLDPYEGAKDIQWSLIRCVGSAFKRFDEDGLRLFRALRFSITKDFVVEFDIHDILKKRSHFEKFITRLPVERVYQELLKCFNHDTWKTLQFLKEYDDFTHFVFQKWPEMWLKPSLEAR